MTKPVWTVLRKAAAKPLTARDVAIVGQYGTRAKNLLKGELKRRGVTYAQLAEKLALIGVTENECNLNNKISRGGLTAAFMLQCLEAIGSRSLQLSDGCS